MALYTKLDVVNRALAVMGQRPVNDLNTPHPTIAAVLDLLRQENITVQSKPFWFNVEVVTLTPQVGNNRLVLPNNTAAADLEDERTITSIRGQWLYNNDKSTFEWDGPVKVTLHRVVPFEELPPTAARYVAARTVMAWQITKDGDSQRTQALQGEAAEAMQSMYAEHTRNVAANLLDRRGVALTRARMRSYSPYYFRG